VKEVTKPGKGFASGRLTQVQRSTGVSDIPVAKQLTQNGQKVKVGMAKVGHKLRTLLKLAEDQHTRKAEQRERSIGEPDT
jgi:hypothetical protein